jgi:DNA polymerase III delta prime subunit
MTTSPIHDVVAGNGSGLATIERALTGGNAAHAYLFAGPGGIGKRTAALAFARGLLCETAGPRPCGSCRSCADVARLRHEDLLLLHGGSNPLWHDPRALLALAGWGEDELARLADLLARLAEHEVIGSPVPDAAEPRRVWPIPFAREIARASESARGKEHEAIANRIEKLRDRGVLSEAEARLARAIALPPLSMVVYRRGPRGLGIALIAPREGRHDRNVKEFLERRPARGGRKVAIVDEAHWMTEEAQNSLLKTLEEPPPGVTLILVTENPGLLLPTIRSRVRQVAWQPLGAADLAQCLARLTRYGHDELAAIAAASGGSPGHALRTDPARFREARAGALALLRASVAGDSSRYLAAVARLLSGRAGRDEERDRVGETIDVLITYVRDVRAAALLGPSAALTHADLRPEIEADCAAFGAPQSARMLPLLLEARDRLAGFSEPRLVIEGLCLPLFPAERALRAAG